MSVSVFPVLKAIVVLPVLWLMNTYKVPHGLYIAGPGVITPPRLNGEGRTVRADKSVFFLDTKVKPHV